MSTPRCSCDNAGTCIACLVWSLVADRYGDGGMVYLSGLAETSRPTETMHSWDELNESRCPEHGVEYADLSDAIEDPRDFRCILCMRDHIEKLERQIEDERAFYLEKRKEAAEALKAQRLSLTADAHRLAPGDGDSQR